VKFLLKFLFVLLSYHSPSGNHRTRAFELPVRIEFSNLLTKFSSNVLFTAEFLPNGIVCSTYLYFLNKIRI